MKKTTSRLFSSHHHTTKNKDYEDKTTMDEKPKANQQTFASVTDGDFDDIIVQENSEENNEDRFPSDVNSGSDDDGNQKKKKKAPNGIDVEEAKETPPDNLQETTPPHGAFAVPGNDSMEERDDSDTDNKIFDITRRRVINQILAGDDKQLLGDGCEDSYGGSRCPRAVIDDIAMPQNPLPNDVEELQENHHTDDNNDDTDGGDPLREAGAPRPPTRRTRRLRITGRPGAIAVRGPGRPRTNNPAEAPVQTNRARAEPVVANPVPSHIVEAEERRAWWDVRQRRQQEQQFHHQAIAIATPVDDDAQQQREDKPFWGNPCFWFVLFGFVAVVGAVGTSLLLRDNPAAAKTEVETPVSPPQPSNETQVGFCNSNSDCKMNQRCANDTCLAKLGTCEVCIRNDECSSTLCLFGKCYPEDGNAPDGCGCTFDGDCNSTRCDDNICKAQLGVCESCNVPSDCLSGRCRFGETCYPNEGPAPNGCICYEDDHCDSGWCGWDLTCQPRLTDGSICFGHNACESGRCAANGTCQAQLEVCEDCVADADCNSGSCKSNSCYPSVGGAPDGCGCTLNDDCEGRCNANGLCQPRYLDGSECTINSDCVSSWCPLDNICQPIPSNLQEFLEQVLGSMAFSDPSSSHVQALDWLEEEDALQNGQGSAATIIQRFVLVLLYLSTNGHSWLPPNQFNFLSAGNSICNWNNGWEGIFCENGLVVQIDLGKPVSVGLDGTIPTEIGLISTLERLLLFNNALTGTIPSELGSLTRLETLSLLDNALSGTIPSELGSLSSLELLILQNNLLTGMIPSELGSLSSLVWFYLYDNALTGTIPSELGSLTRLELLWLKDNALTGMIPSELGSLQNIEVLALHRNSLTGKITGNSPFCDRSVPINDFYTDCGGDNPEVICDCCTDCCEVISYCAPPN